MNNKLPPITAAMPSCFNGKSDISHWANAVKRQNRHGQRRLIKQAARFFHTDKLKHGGTRTSWRIAKQKAVAFVAKVQAQHQEELAAKRAGDYRPCAVIEMRAVSSNFDALERLDLVETITELSDPNLFKGEIAA